MPTHSRKAVLLATDQQRSVLNALDAGRSHTIAYSPYGYRPRENGLLSLLGFNGERPDSLTGHYHLGNGYRQFNPVLMRFNSPDSWSPFGKGGLNAYTYCWGDPVNSTDPTGHTPAFLKSILRAVGLMRKSQTKVAKTVSTAASHGSVDAPLPLNSSKTTSGLTPTGFNSDHINLETFPTENNSNLPPHLTTKTRRTDTLALLDDTTPTPLVTGQYEGFLDVSIGSANNAPLQELINNHIWLGETPGPSRLADKLQYALEKIRLNIDKRVS